LGGILLLADEVSGSCPVGDLHPYHRRPNDGVSACCKDRERRRAAAHQKSERNRNRRNSFACIHTDTAVSRNKKLA
jgi:hypothetical protein